MGKATVLKLASDGFSLPSVLIFRSQFNTSVSIFLLRKVYTDFLLNLWLPHNDTWLGNQAIPFLYYRRLCSGAPEEISSCPLPHTRKRRHLTLLGLAKKPINMAAINQLICQLRTRKYKHEIIHAFSFNIQINAQIYTQELPS